MCATKIEVNIPGLDPYDVRIGEGVLDQLGMSMRAIPSLEKAKRALIITDSNVGPLYLDQAKEALTSSNFRVNDITIPAGEESKNVQVLNEIWEAMAGLSLGRDCVVVALGGGVVGDMAGFAAATYMRGVEVVQVPTTLLSTVDSSVGGKTGVNLSAGKNLVGNFKQPAFVCADTNTLRTLDAREWACGLGEIAKSAVIDGDDFFFWLSENAKAMASRNATVVTEAIARCVVFKADVVAQDQTESRGVRECLNYGHTLAHAIEVLAGYGTYSHGAAVAEGMRFAMLLGNKMVGTPSDLVDAQASLLDTLGLPALEWKTSPLEILRTMKRDKKARDGEVRFVLASDLGQWEIMSIEDADIIGSLQEWAASKRL